MLELELCLNIPLLIIKQWANSLTYALVKIGVVVVPILKDYERGLKYDIWSFHYYY